MPPVIAPPMRTSVRDAISRAWARAVAASALPVAAADATRPPVEVERPADPSHGDFASALAMKLARPYKMAPLAIASALADELAREVAENPEATPIASVEVTPPGFLNLRLADRALETTIEGILTAPTAWGRVTATLPRSVNVEFVYEARPVTVHSFGVDGTADPSVLRIEVHCSAGTYIRSLADDLGRLLGGGAHLRHLRRTAVGSFTVAEARPPDSSELMSPLEALRDYPRVDVDVPTADMVRHGRVLDRFDGDGPWAVVDTGGVLLAVYELFGTAAKPAVVIA